MEQNNFSEFPWMPSPEETKKKNKSRGRGVSVGTLISFVCLAIALTLILTYTAAFALARAEYADALEQYDAALKGTQEELINAERTVEHLQRLLDAASGEAIGKFGKLDFLSMLFEETSYYIDSVSEEERINAVLGDL